MDPQPAAPNSADAAARLRIVEEHLHHENAHDVSGIMATFADAPEYHDEPWDERHIGRRSVEKHYRDLLIALPDLRIDVRDRFVTDAVVVLEVVISGTHQGSWRGLPATGRRVRFPLCAIYRFAPNGKLASETIYYDRAGVLRQVGLYREPVGVAGRVITALTHPVTLTGALLRKLRAR